MFKAIQFQSKTISVNLAQNPLQWEWGFASFANGSCRNRICWGLLFLLAQFIKIHFLPHLESFMWKQQVEKKLYNSLMGCSPFTNYHFQMGVTVVGFAEHFGQIVIIFFLSTQSFFTFNVCCRNAQGYSWDLERITRNRWDFRTQRCILIRYWFSTDF